MSYASRFFQSVGATSVHASAARLTSIANAVKGRKALRHAFESARYGERSAAMLYPHQREAAKQLKKHIVVPKISEAVARADALRNAAMEGGTSKDIKTLTTDYPRTVDGVTEGSSYMPKRRNQHSKPYKVVALMVGTRDVMFHRGDLEKVGSISLAKFIEKVKL